MKVKVRVVANALVEVEAEDYLDAYVEEQGDELAEGFTGPVPTEFAVAKFQEDIEDGNLDLAMVLENASIDVILEA